MLNKPVIVTFYCVFFSIAIGAQSGSNSTAKEITLKVSTESRIRFSSPETSEAEILFRNDDDKPVRLLNVFDNPRAKRVQFSIIVRDKNGTPYGPFGGGKISLPQNSMKYIELKRFEEFKVKIDLKGMLSKNLNLPIGTYAGVITYFNQYGENCFRGRIISNTFYFSILEQ